MAKYIGITIGPIVATIKDASSPAALWFASSMFSDLTRRLCEAISKETNFVNVKIISPYYDDSIDITDGIGKFHDRIIFSVEKFDEERLKEIIKNEKENIIKAFPNNTNPNNSQFTNEKAKSFINDYVQVNYVVLENLTKKNTILTITPYLDALELMPTFSRDDSNNILQTLFNGDNFSRNSYIKQSELYTRIKTEANQFRKNRDSFRTIEDIASVNKDKNNKIKTDNYYAVVQADGDNMGKFLSDLNDESVGEFSKRCLNYTSKAVKKIGEYGGMTIYAGGDDLLFLAPVTDKEGKLIIKLCKEINDVFKEEMKDIQGADNNKIPTISFGVSIQYCKAPLYEAINKARGFLFGVAKDSKSEKNRIALNVQKHSGQSFGIIIPNNEVETANKVFDAVSEDIIAKNALQTIKKFKGFLSLAAEKLKNNKDSFKKSWSNWFDNVNQAGNSYYETLGDLFYDNFVNNDSKISRISDEKETTDKINSEKLNAYISLLSIKKFMIEKEVIE